MGVLYNPRIVTNGLVLALDAANPKSYPGTGTTWNDLSGNGNNGTLTNGPTYSSINNGSIVFDGTNDYVDVTNSNGFGEVNTAPTISLEIWANISRKSGGGLQFQHIAGFRNDSNFDAYFLLLDASGAFVNTEARIRTASNTFDISINYITYFDKWTHIVFTADSTRSDLYINGILLGSQTSVTGSFGASSSNFGIGQTNSNYPVKGNISLVRFYNRALSATEVLQNFNALRGRYGI